VTKLSEQERDEITAQLLCDAANEITRLRTDVAALQGYKRHTERMLALFEGGPRAESRMGEGEDLAWKLRRVAEEFRKLPTGTDD
jgi:hypothetical protein